MMPSSTAPTEKQQSVSWFRIAAIGRNPRTTLIRAAVLAAVCLGLFHWVLLPARVEGISMIPTYADHSFDFINRLAYLGRDPKRGDVVGIRLTAPDGWAPPHVMYFKRIIGLPGETISFVDGRVFVNGRVLDEPYENGKCDWNVAPEKLKPGEYYFVGDNRAVPKEDHVFGRAERNHIVGTALW